MGCIGAVRYAAGDVMGLKRPRASRKITTAQGKSDGSRSVATSVFTSIPFRMARKLGIKKGTLLMWTWVEGENYFTVQPLEK